MQAHPPHLVEVCAEADEGEDGGWDEDVEEDAEELPAEGDGDLDGLHAAGLHHLGCVRAVLRAGLTPILVDSTSYLVRDGGPLYLHKIIFTQNLRKMHLSSPATSWVNGSKTLFMARVSRHLCTSNGYQPIS